MNVPALSAALGFLGVALGAFGAHGLEGRIAPELLDAYQTGVDYHLLHAVVLLVISGSKRLPSRRRRITSTLFLVGILLFSGSLYLLAATGVRALGMVTPLGGLLLLGGWASAAWSLLKSPRMEE